MALWSRLTSFLAGGAVARASSDSVTPVLEPVRQHAWQKNQLRVLDANQAAQLVASGGWNDGDAADEASRSGYNTNRLNALIYLAQVAPSVAEGLTLYRRKLIDKTQLEHAYAKAKIDPAYWDAITTTAHLLLSVDQVANAIQQGHLPNEGILPDVGNPAPNPEGYIVPKAVDGNPPTNVPLTQIDLDGVQQAEYQGTSFEQLQVIANLVGLPPGSAELLAMLNRGIITDEAFDAGIREGHLKTKWTQAFKRMRWAVLSAQDAASARLRTWITAEESYAIGALTGHTKEQMDLLFLNRGRPASPTQMWRAWARKKIGPRGVPVEYEDHAKAIAISDIRPEYAEMLWEIRFNYPSLFQLNRLVTAGTVDADTAATWAEYNLYAPEVVDSLRTAWAKAQPAKGDAHVTKAQTQLWNTTHKSYLAEETATANVTDRLNLLGVPASSQTEVLKLWDAERSLIRSQLSPSDIRKALDKQVINPATGVAWTLAEATQALLDRGYDAADATTYLTTPLGSGA